MLYWSLVFLVVALVAGVLGFGGVARVMFFVFLILFAVSLVTGRGFAG